MKKAFYSFRSPQIHLGDLCVELLFYVVYDPTPKGVGYDKNFISSISTARRRLLSMPFPLHRNRIAHER